MQYTHSQPRRLPDPPHRLDFATRSSSSFFCRTRDHLALTERKMEWKRTLMAYEFEEPFAALMSSSAKHSATDLTLRNADSRVCCKTVKQRGTTGAGYGAYTGGQERDRLVHPAQGGDIDGLTPDGSLGTDTCRVLTGTSVHDGVHEDLDRVLVGKEVDDLKCVGDDPEGKELLAVVAALHHQAVQAFGMRLKERQGVGHTYRRDAQQWASAPS